MKVVGADPHVIYDKKSSNYYAYVTSNVNNGMTFDIYKSKDLISWSYVGNALKTDDENTWGKDWFWAPECYYSEKADRYFLFYSAKVKDEILEKHFYDNSYDECCKIGVATSKSPEGPFINICNQPIDYYPYDDEVYDLEPALKDKNNGRISLEEAQKIAKKGAYISQIDANLFVDDERMYLYYSRCCYRNWVYDEKLKKFIEESNINCVEITTDWFFDKDGKTMPQILDTYKRIENGQRKDKYHSVISYHKDPQEWENGHVDDYSKYKGTKKDRRWSEGSTTFTRIVDGKKVYFITYSCNNYENEMYGIGYATSDSPITGFKKSNLNPIIHQIPEENIYSTGHGSWIKKDDKDIYIFHGRDVLDHPRILYYGEMEIKNKDIKRTSFKKSNLK